MFLSVFLPPYLFLYYTARLNGNQSKKAVLHKITNNSDSKAYLRKFSVLKFRLAIHTEILQEDCIICELIFTEPIFDSSLLLSAFQLPIPLIPANIIIQKLQFAICTIFLLLYYADCKLIFPEYDFASHFFKNSHEFVWIIELRVCLRNGKESDHCRLAHPAVRRPSYCR